MSSDQIPLFQRIASAVQSAGRSAELIQLQDYKLYLDLVAECLRLVGGLQLPNIKYVADATTRGTIGKLLPPKADVTILGPPQKPAGKKASGSPQVSPLDRFFAITSAEVNLAIAGTCDEMVINDMCTFTGAWSFTPPAVAQMLGECMACDIEAAPHATSGSSIASHLMTMQLEKLMARHRDVTLDKDDLFSVLNILKAISTKRRAHDILFVFVEHIARIVNSDRCSIVRVWGGEEHGHVLASHENINISNHDIDLTKYPELLESMKKREKIVINDVATNALLQEQRQELQRAKIHAVLVIPIVLFDENVGSLFLRAARYRGGFSEREIGFFEIVAEAASNALERAHLFETIQIANEQLERQAITDGLTGLYNHRHFRERFEQEFNRAIRYRLPLTCLLFDVDDFKNFNDTYGHLQGDSILREMAERVMRCVRKSDIVARYGGEEFVVIMPQTGETGANTEGERLRATICSKLFRGLPEGVTVTVSVGIGVLNHEIMRACEDLLRAADQALYDAKRQGKNRVVTQG